MNGKAQKGISSDIYQRYKRETPNQIELIHESLRGQSNFTPEEFRNLVDTLEQELVQCIE